MCRLFGFRSILQSGVHRSLVGADNALAVQSNEHPDGWGVAYYLADVPHLIKGASAAVEDSIFRRVSGVVASETVVAHIRKATTGPIDLLNSHPFQHGPWVFAHNGQIRDFERHRDALLEWVHPTLRRYILGTTDSEVFFYLVLSRLRRRHDLYRRGAELHLMAAALGEAISMVREICDAAPLPDGERPSMLTALLTDGHSMVGVRARKPLLYSTYKGRCSDRDACPHLAEECEAPTRSGFVSHLIFSSEELHGENVWIALEEDEMIGCDWRMRLHRGAVHTVDGAVMSPVGRPRSTSDTRPLRTTPG